MTRQKIILIVVIPLVAIALLAGGFFLGKGKLFSKENASTQDSSEGGSTNNVIPLGQDSNSAGGLSVTSSGAMDLGQLGENGANGSQSGASAGSSSSASPSDFKNYEKYKNEQHALFGDAVVGKGAELTANRKAAIYYKGWLTNGQLFDQTRTNANGQKEPLIFTLGAHEVVPGLEEGVAGMKVGGKRLVVIPPAVGYGEKGNGPVPANAVMVFEIELVTVQ